MKGKSKQFALFVHSSMDTQKLVIFFIALQNYFLTN